MDDSHVVRGDCWPDPSDLAPLPWYGADHTLPASRFIPGLMGREPSQSATVHGPWTPEQWPTLQSYLRGVDLFNRWYFWEAHESWESLWRAQPAQTKPAQYIQGVIAAAASLLKLRMGQVLSAQTLSTAACQRLATFRGVWMGLEVDRFRADLTRCLADSPQAHMRAHGIPRIHLAP